MYNSLTALLHDIFLGRKTATTAGCKIREPVMGCYSVGTRKNETSLLRASPRITTVRSKANGFRIVGDRERALPTHSIETHTFPVASTRPRQTPKRGGRMGNSDP